MPFLTHELLPSSFVAPFVDNKILQILVLAILTAASISALAPRLRERIVSVIDVISKIIFGIIRLIMWAAPLGAFGGMAYTVAVFGASSLENLALLMVTFWVTRAIFVFVILGSVAAWSGFNIFKLVRLIKDELLIIVGTSSSETVLPRLLAKLESAGASRQTVGVVIPTGYSFNLDGTCIYLTLAALFIVQAGGQTLPLGAQIGLCALMVLTSKGAAGITGAGLVTLVASLQAFGGEFFSPESIAIGIALVVGIDRVMSEGRALTNAIGNSVATMVIAKLPGRTRRRTAPGGAERPQPRRRGHGAGQPGRRPLRRGLRGGRGRPARGAPGVRLPVGDAHVRRARAQVGTCAWARDGVRRFGDSVLVAVLARGAVRVGVARPVWRPPRSRATSASDSRVRASSSSIRRASSGTTSATNASARRVADAGAAADLGCAGRRSRWPARRRRRPRPGRRRPSRPEHRVVARWPRAGRRSPGRR